MLASRLPPVLPPRTPGAVAAEARRWLDAHHEAVADAARLRAIVLPSDGTHVPDPLADQRDALAQDLDREAELAMHRHEALLAEFAALTSA